MGKFRSLGLSDVRIQPLDLPPQWIPQNWDVALTEGGRTIHLDSAQPDYDDNPLPAGGVDLDAVYAGLGTEADFAGKDAVLARGAHCRVNTGGQMRADEPGRAPGGESSLRRG